MEFQSIIQQLTKGGWFWRKWAINHFCAPLSLFTSSLHSAFVHSGNFFAPKLIFKNVCLTLVLIRIMADLALYVGSLFHIVWFPYFSINYFLWKVYVWWCIFTNFIVSYRLFSNREQSLEDTLTIVDISVFYYQNVCPCISQNIERSRWKTNFLL